MPAGDGLLDDLLPRCAFPPAGSTVSCAFSGGADSSALLVLAARAGCRVTAIHVDHGLRPTSSVEADHAQRLASLIGVPFERRTVEVEPGPNLEARARAARSAVLPVDVLTGHTADDQAETVLINLLRGAGSSGMAAMRPGPTKPLLQLRHAETLNLCATLGLDPVDDPSNADRRFLRNRVRHEVLPLLSSVAMRDVVPLLTRTASVLRDDNELLDHLAKAIDPTDARPSGHSRAGARPPSPADVDLRRRLSTRPGDPRTGDGRGSRRRQGLRAGEREAPRTSPPAPAHRGRRRPSNLYGGAVTSANGMSSPGDEIGTLVASSIG